MSAGSYPTWNSGRALRLMPQAQDREGKTEKDGGLFRAAELDG
jgi:hypothetical protein